MNTRITKIGIICPFCGAFQGDERIEGADTHIECYQCETAATFSLVQEDTGALKLYIIWEIPKEVEVKRFVACEDCGAEAICTQRRQTYFSDPPEYYDVQVCLECRDSWTLNFMR